MPEALRPAETPPPPGGQIANLANIVTIARLCAVPLAVGLVLNRHMAQAFAVFTLAGLSDALDGWLARRHGGSALGAALDPLADKALLIAMIATLAAMGALPVWIALLVVARDAVILGGAWVLWRRGRLASVRPLWISKLNTALQLVLVGVALLLQALDLHAPALLNGLIAIVAVSTLVSGAAYVVRKG